MAGASPLEAGGGSSAGGRGTSHVQTAGGSLAGNDESLISSTVTPKSRCSSLEVPSGWVECMPTWCPSLGCSHLEPMCICGVHGRGPVAVLYACRGRSSAAMVVACNRGRHHRGAIRVRMSRRGGPAVVCLRRGCSSWWRLRSWAWPARAGRLGRRWSHTRATAAVTAVVLRLLPRPWCSACCPTPTGRTPCCGLHDRANPNGHLDPYPVAPHPAGVGSDANRSRHRCSADRTQGAPRSPGELVRLRAQAAAGSSSRRAIPAPLAGPPWRRRLIAGRMPTTPTNPAGMGGSTH
jgi:hypothetical protein